MSKSLSLLFACIAMLLMAATAVAISYNGWFAMLFFLLAICTIGFGFITKARLRRKRKPQE